jgi:hypothetical protein
VLRRATLDQVSEFGGLGGTMTTEDTSTSDGFVGAWMNQWGSTMNITKVECGQITGTYEEGDSRQGCPYGKGEFLLSGRTCKGEDNKTLLGFDVGFENTHLTCKAAKSWSGWYDSKNEQITTIWMSSEAAILGIDGFFMRVGTETFKRKSATTTEVTQAPIEAELTEHPSSP